MAFTLRLAGQKSLYQGIDGVLECWIDGKGALFSSQSKHSQRLCWIRFIKLSLLLQLSN